MPTCPTENDATFDAAKEFRDLLQRVRDGDEDAAWELIDRYGPHIFRVVRRRLNARIRSKFDSADFVQAVWASFFTSRAEILSFNQPEELIGFLAQMAQNKVLTEVRRRLQYTRNNVTHEQPLDDSTLPAPIDAAANQPSPSQVAVARERWERMLNNSPPQWREILEMRYRGATYEEVALKLGMHERSIRKIVEQMLERAHQRF
jgi:RNA polymerase sigma-70 factor (ECF subfamily)